MSPDEQTALAYVCEMFWDEAAATLAPDDRAELARLTGAGSPDFVGRDADYYGFVTYTLFSSRVP